MAIITIPKNLAANDDLVVIPRKELEALIASANVSEDDVLAWSREAKRLHRAHKLPKLTSLRKL